MSRDHIARSLMFFFFFLDVLGKSGWTRQTWKEGRDD